MSEGENKDKRSKKSDNGWIGDSNLRTPLYETNIKDLGTGGKEGAQKSKKEQTENK